MSEGSNTPEPATERNNATRNQNPSIVFNLPNDIFYAIVIIAYNEEPREFPARVAAVCHQWRQFALGVGVLWSRVNFHHPPPYDRQLFLLKRSRDSPLTINIKEPHKKTGRCMKTISAILKTLIPHAHRLKSLQIIHVKGKAVKLIFDELRSAVTPSLEEVVIDSSIQPDAWTLKLPAGSQLKKLHISCGKTSWNPKILENLISLILGAESWGIKWSMTTYDVLTALENTPRLKVFKIHDASCSISVATWNKPQIVLNSLEELWVNPYVGYSAAWTLEILTSIVAPKLHRLQRPREISLAWFPIFNSLPSFPFPSLEYLDTVGVVVQQISQIVAQHIPPLMTNLPRLRRLDIRGEHITDEVFAALSSGHPNLHELVVTTRDVSLERLKNLVLARKNDPSLASIDYIALLDYQVSYVEEEDQAWFRDQVQECVFAYVGGVDPKPRLFGPEDGF